LLNPIDVVEWSPLRMNRPLSKLALLEKIGIFGWIYRQILMPYANIWQKNLSIKTPKKTILASK